MNNVIEFLPEKITELFNELKDVLNRASLSDVDELFTCWEDFKKAYSVLDDLNYEAKLSEDEDSLLSELKYKFDGIIEDKQKEIRNLTKKNLEEGRELKGEEFINNSLEFCELDKKSTKLLKLQHKVADYTIETFHRREEETEKEFEELEIRLKEKKEISHKILANQEDYTDEQIQTAKEFLLVFFGEEN